MDNKSNIGEKPSYPSAPTYFAFHDAWLQIRSKPGLYLLIWATLALFPYLILSRIMAGPLSDSIMKFMEYIQIFSNSGGIPTKLPPDLESLIRKILGYSGLLWFLSIIITIFYTSVLFSTVKGFNRHTIPRYTRSLADGLVYYGILFKSVALTAWKILWKPLACFIICIFLGTIAFNGLFTSFGIIGGMVLLLPGLYRYGLVPFIQLASELPFRESSLLNQHFYNRSRASLIILFLWLIFLPIFASILLTAVFIQMKMYSGFGSIVLWFLQSALKFISLMTLSNFAMNIFSGLDNEIEVTGDSTESAV